MADYFGEQLEKLILLGIGAAAATVEKSHSLVDELVAKGELTVEQGKVLNEELHHNADNKSVKIPCNAEKKDQTASSENIEESKASKRSLADKLEDLSPEEIQTIREKLAKMDKAGAAKGKQDGKKHAAE